MAFPGTIDFKNPDYREVILWRTDMLRKIRSDPSVLKILKKHYAAHPEDFIEDWGCTFDPRNSRRGLPTIMPFILFPRQKEWIQWVMDKMNKGEPGISEKSRDFGLSNLAVDFAATLCLFRDDIAIGFGSRKADYVDKNGSPKSLFYKMKQFIEFLPPEFNGGWNRRKHSSEMRISFPNTGSVVTGEGGDGIGRGDRALIYFIDESAFLEHPEMIDASLAATTECRIDISTPNGLANSFAQKRMGGKIDVFTCHWTQDPRKDQAWYEKQQLILDPITLAQEVDLNYSASVEGVLIPAAYVDAAIDAHIKLGFGKTGSRTGAYDVADRGIDKNAFCGKQGIVADHLEEWSGKGDDIYGSVERVFGICDMHRYEMMFYDADGLGAGVKGDSRKINEERRAKGFRDITFEPYIGCGEIHDPEGQMMPDRENQDFFGSYKTQSYWSLRIRFEKTYRCVMEGMTYPEDELISLSSSMPLIAKAKIELSQPIYIRNRTTGKVLVDKQPDGIPSPNLADAICMAYNPKGFTTQIWERLAE